MKRIKTLLNNGTEQEKTKKKILLLLLGFSFVIVPLTYAIFKTIGNSSKSLVAATWDVTLNQSQENEYISLLPDPSGTTMDYTINITSQSEVDINYSIVISNIPSGVSISLDNDPTFTQPVNNTITFSNVGTIGYNDLTKTKSHTLTFKASSGASYVDEQEVDINVVAKQAV